MNIDTNRTLSAAVLGINTYTYQYLSFQSNHPLHQNLRFVKIMYHRADGPVTKPDDMLSEQEHLRQSQPM